MPSGGEDNNSNDINNTIGAHMSTENDEAFKDIPSILQRNDEDSDSDSDSYSEDEKIHKQNRSQPTTTGAIKNSPPIRKAPGNNLAKRINQKIH